MVSSPLVLESQRWIGLVVEVELSVLLLWRISNAAAIRMWRGYHGIVAGTFYSCVLGNELLFSFPLPSPLFFTSWRHTFGQARALLLHPTSHHFPHNHMIAQSFLCSVPPVKSRDEKRQFQRLFFVQPWITKRCVVQTQILLRYAPSTAHALRHCVTCELEMYAT